MAQKINTILVIIFLFFQSAFGSSLDSLLEELAKKDDLSTHTKKEDAGYLTIFTRQDLDRMKIKSLKEIIEKIPFTRYNENANGFSDPFYHPYQTNNPARIRIYINDRELVTPLFGSGLQILGQMDMDYIDHIEVYMGLPSYEISLEPAFAIIKLYTKNGERENTSVVGVSAGTYGTSDIYTYKSEALDTYSYFVYANHRNLKREPIEHLTSKLSRDKDTSDVYAQLSTINSRFEIQAIQGNMDNFMGSSWDITPKNSGTRYKYLYAGYNYNSLDKGLKASINYSYLSEKYYDSSSAPLGIISPIATPPFYMLYYSKSFETYEHLLDTRITKRYTTEKSTYLLGFSNRLKNFVFDKFKLNNANFPINIDYDTEDVVSLFGEMNYSLNDRNRLIVSLNSTKYFENSSVEDETIYGTRIGHIYSSENFTQKSFIFSGKFRPPPYVLLMQNITNQNANGVRSENAYAISTESYWRYDNTDISLLLSRTIMKDSIYFDGVNYLNSEGKATYDSISFKDVYRFNSTDNIEFGAWLVVEDYGKFSQNRYKNEYGSHITLYKKLGKLDTYNSLTYIDGYVNKDAGWNYNATLTYKYSKNLSLFIKGENLLKKALKTDYFRVNPLTNQKTTLDNISVFDRTILVGMEYKF